MSTAGGTGASVGPGKEHMRRIFFRPSLRKIELRYTLDPNKSLSYIRSYLIYLTRMIQLHGGRRIALVRIINYPAIRKYSGSDETG